MMENQSAHGVYSTSSRRDLVLTKIRGRINGIAHKQKSIQSRLTIKGFEVATVLGRKPKRGEVYVEMGGMIAVFMRRNLPDGAVINRYNWLQRRMDALRLLESKVMFMSCSPIPHRTIGNYNVVRKMRSAERRGWLDAEEERTLQILKNFHQEHGEKLTRREGVGVWNSDCSAISYVRRRHT